MRQDRMPYELNETEIFALLAKRRRRLLLRILQDSGTPLTMIEVANCIGDCEYDNPSTKEVRAIQLTLYHNHIPRLEEADVVEYKKTEGTLRPGQNFGTLVRFLESVSEEDLPWSDA